MTIEHSLDDLALEIKEAAAQAEAARKYAAEQVALEKASRHKWVAAILSVIFCLSGIGIVFNNIGCNRANENRTLIKEILNIASTISLEQDKKLPEQERVIAQQRRAEFNSVVQPKLKPIDCSLL